MHTPYSMPRDRLPVPDDLLVRHPRLDRMERAIKVRGSEVSAMAGEVEHPVFDQADDSG
jgi:hypothetical protein